MAQARNHPPRTWAEVDEKELTDAAQRLSRWIGADTDDGKRDPQAKEEGNRGTPGTRHPNQDRTHVLREERWCKDPLGWGWCDTTRGMLCQEVEKGEGGAEEKEEDGERGGSNGLLSPKSNHTERRTSWIEGQLENKDIRTNSQGFDPVAYLTIVHRETTLEKLEQGTKVLQEELSERKGQLKALVKDNFERFISCKNTIDHLHARMKYVGDGTENLASIASLKVSLEQLNAQSKRIYGPMLERQDQIQRIKKVLDLLGRFKSLLGLPKQFREYVRKGEHTKIVTEYSRAKGLIQKTSMGILHKLLGELQKMLKEMAQNMYVELENPELGIDEAERIVRHLLELKEVEESLWADFDQSKQDPVGYYLQLLHDRITNLFKNCTLNYMERMEALEEELQEHAEAESRWRELHGDVDLSARALDSAVSPSTEQRTPHTKELEERGVLLSLRLVRRLCAVAAANIPFFCSLLSTFRGSYTQGDRSTALDEEAFDAMTLDLFACFSVSVKDAYNDFIKRTLTIETLSQSIVEFLQTTHAIQLDPCTSLGKDAISALRAELFGRFFWYLQKSANHEMEQLINNTCWAPEQLPIGRPVFEVPAEKYGTLLPESALELEGVVLRHLDKIESLAGSCGGEASTVAALWQSFSPILFRCLTMYLNAVQAVVSIPGTTDVELSGCLCAIHFIQEHTAASLLRSVRAGHLQHRVDLLREFAGALEEFCSKAQEVESKAAEALVERHFAGLSNVVSAYVQGFESLQERDVGTVRYEALDVLEFLLSFRADMLRLPDSFTRKIMPLFVTQVMDALASAVARVQHGKGPACKQLAFEMQYFLTVLDVYIEDSIQQKCLHLINGACMSEDHLSRLIDDGIAKTRLMTLCFSSARNE
eukprot:scaffold221_cov351-Pavlova_lutheri.AAC.8